MATGGSIAADRPYCQDSAIKSVLNWRYSNLPAVANLVASVKITDSDCELFMDNDLILFLGSISLLILYLVWSAKTEMGTKNPWKK